MANTNTRGISSITVTFEDGAVETFKTERGFYRMHHNHLLDGHKVVDEWDEHEIRWHIHRIAPKPDSAAVRAIDEADLAKNKEHETVL